MKINDKIMCTRHLLVLLFFALPYVASAQTNKIGIVFDADTTLISQFLGVTIFSNSTNTLPLNVDTQGYITQKLKSYLDDKYTAELITLPDSLKGTKLGFFDSNVGKKLRNWSKTKEKEYDIVIFIRNQEVPELTMFTPENTSGLCTRHRKTHLYTTITFYAYRTADAKQLEYYNLGGKLLYQLKKFKLPKDKKSFSPETLTFLEEEYKKYLDGRIKHFLAKTYILPDIK